LGHLFGQANQGPAALGENLGIPRGLTNAGITLPNGQFESPQEAQNTIPDAGPLLSGGLENAPTTTPSTLHRPSFLQAASMGATPGGVNATSPGLSKGGKLIAFLQSGLQGALAGRAKSEEAVAASGGHRSAGFGTGFQSGFQLPFLRASQQQQVLRGQAEADIAQQQAQNLPSMMNTQRQQSQAELVNTQAQTALRKAETEKALRPPVVKPENAQQLYAQAVQNAVKRGVNPAQDPTVQQYADAITSLQKQSTPAESVHTVNTGEGVQQYDPATKTWKRIGSSPKSNLNLLTQSDAKDIADAIESGDQPPTLQGLYRNAAPVRAELARRGVPLAKMETDWKATQRFMSSLNSTQQVRLQQSIATATDSLDKIQSLYDEWQKLVPQTGFKVINHATLIAMKNLPGRPGAVAQALDAQIADVTSELGNVYMGGNSPTDQSLKLARENFSADWNKPTFEEGLNQARLNLGIRKNSIFHSKPAGVSPDSPYMPNQAPQAPPPATKDPFAQFGGKARQ
jgi:hypothetical protein